MTGLLGERSVDPTSLITTLMGNLSSATPPSNGSGKCPDTALCLCAYNIVNVHTELCVSTHVRRSVSVCPAHTLMSIVYVQVPVLYVLMCVEPGVPYSKENCQLFHSPLLSWLRGYLSRPA